MYICLGKKDRLLPVERGVLNCLRKEKSTPVVERDIFTFKCSKRSSVWIACEHENFGKQVEKRDVKR